MCFVNKFLKQTRVKFYSEKIESCGRDQKTLFKGTKNLLGRNEEAVLPTSSSTKELAQNFSDFFTDKIDGIRDKISSDTEAKIGAVTTEEIPNTQIDTLVEFTPVSQDELERLFQNLKVNRVSLIQFQHGF